MEAAAWGKEELLCMHKLHRRPGIPLPPAYMPVRGSDFLPPLFPTKLCEPRNCMFPGRPRSLPMHLKHQHHRTSIRNSETAMLHQEKRRGKKRQRRR